MTLNDRKIDGCKCSQCSKRSKSTQIQVRYDLFLEKLIFVFETEDLAQRYQAKNPTARILQGYGSTHVLLPTPPGMRYIEMSVAGMLVGFHSTEEAQKWDIQVRIGMCIGDDLSDDQPAVFIPIRYAAGDMDAFLGSNESKAPVERAGSWRSRRVMAAAAAGGSGVKMHEGDKSFKHGK